MMIRGQCVFTTQARWTLLLAALAFLPQGRALSAETSPATTIVYGTVWTGDSEQPQAEAIAIAGDRIQAVGSRDEIDRFRGDKTTIIDAGNGMIVPGLIDSHIHLLSGGYNLTSVQLRDANSPAEFAKRIGDYALSVPAGTWIRGGDWDHTLWGGELPDRAWIDRVTPTHPVWLNRLDGHMALANTAALRAAGVTDDVPDVPGGEIVRNERGRLTGILKDNAMTLVERAVPERTQQEQLAAIEAAVEYVAARGVTTVHQMGEWSDVEALRLAEQRGLLKIRVYACTPLSEWRRLVDELASHGRGSPWLRVGGLKGFVDGSLGSHTAAFLEPYSDAPASRGVLVNTPEHLEQWTLAADKAGLQVMVHAIGDRAIRIQLDIFEKATQENGPRDRRFRIEHAQHIHPDDLPRFAELDVIASMQPYHAIDDGRWADGAIGAERSLTTYAFRSLLDSGARLALGSDWHVAPPTPLEGVYAAVTRRTIDGEHPDGWVPSQKISVDEALRGYTADAAYAGFMEDEIGTLAAGKYADLVIVDHDLNDMPPEQLDQAQVMLTMTGGDVVFANPDFQGAPQNTASR